MAAPAPPGARALWILGPAPAFLWMPWILAVPLVLPWGQTAAAALQGVGFVAAGLLALRWPRGGWTRFPWALLVAGLVLLASVSTPAALLAWAVSGMAMARILLETFEAVPSVRGLGIISLSFNVANLAVPALSAIAFAAAPPEAVLAAAALPGALCHRAVLRRPPAKIPAGGICRRCRACCPPPASWPQRSPSASAPPGTPSPCPPSRRRWG